MKAVMKSISPRICEKVANGNCTILVSKTAPKCGLPFKGYIYCTNGEMLFDVRREIYLPPKVRIKPFRLFFGKSNGALYPSIPIVNRKVVGECIIDKIDEIVPDYNPVTAKFYYGYVADTAATCLSEEELQKYGKNKSLYFWHISDLKIYDKPKELSEFRGLCKVKTACHNCPHYNYSKMDCDSRVITRAPQSWQYVEELEV